MPQAMHKVVDSKVPEVEKRKRKKRGATKPMASSVATASPVEASSGVLSDDSKSPNPATKKKKAELLQTTAAGMEKLKERLKTEIHGGRQKELTLPALVPLRPEF